MKTINELNIELFKVPDLLYHYTTIEAFLNIINSSEIWLTKYDYLNDPTETTYTKELIEEIFIENEIISTKDYLINILDRIEKQSEFSFVFSLCVDNDSLGMWSYYSKFDGINIHLSNDFFKESHYFDKNGNFFSVNKGKVIYERKIQKEILLDIFNNYIHNSENQSDEKIKKEENRNLGYLLSICYNLFKQEGLKNENEFRFIFTGHGDNILKSTDFRTKDIKIIPFNKLPFNLTSIVGFTISPTLNDEKLIEALKLVLLKNGITHDIQKSKIILRK